MNDTNPLNKNENENSFYPSANNDIASMDEGYIKFDCQHTEAKWHDVNMPLSQEMEEKLLALDRFRTSLYYKKLIGVYENGIGYGNISMRDDKKCAIFESNQEECKDDFIISASATGGREILGFDGYCLIPKTEIDLNRVWSLGTLKASSETMTHAAIYRSAPKVNCVVHVHDKILYSQLLARNNIPKTQENIPYGTVEMAYALMQIAKENPLGACVVMGGHDEGILFYDIGLKQVCERMKKYYSLED